MPMASKSSDPPDLPSPRRSDDRPCRVCASRINSTHFGVDVCRACSMFFRRSTGLKLNFKCNGGQQKCNISYEDNPICKACRLQKCWDIGMDPGNLQRRAKSKKRDESQSGTTPKQPTCDTKSKKDTATPTKIPPKIRPIETPLLDLLAKQFKLYMASCLMSDDGLSAAEATAAVAHPKAPLKLRPTTFDDLQRSSIIGPQNSIIFGSKCFTLFDKLSEEEKNSLARDFLGAVFTIVSTHRTCQLIPRKERSRIARAHREREEKEMIARCTCEPQCNRDSEKVQKFSILRPPPRMRIMATVSTYFDLVNMDEVFSVMDDQGGTKEWSTVTSNNVFRLQKGIEIAARAKFDEKEHAAILGIAFWPIAYKLFTDQVIEIGQQVHKTIFKELDVYYRSVKNMEDYSERICNIHAMLAFIELTSHQLAEDVEMYRLVELVDENDDLYNALRKL